MKNLIKHIVVWVTILMLCSCKEPDINEKNAALIVKNRLSLPGNVYAQKLSGGFSNTINFLIINDKQKYVIRFFKKIPREESKIEMDAFKIAAEYDYGPKVYFMNPAKGIIIMEHLVGKKVTDRDFCSKRFYILLSQFLRKIHDGPKFQGEYNAFKRIDKNIQDDKKYDNYIPITKIEHIVTIIHQTLLPILNTTIPCHNDLHGGNIFFLGDKFKAIDYGDAGQNDPYFDLATVLATNSKPHYEKFLLKMYLGHEPSILEESKLYLMKQLLLIKWSLDAINRLKSSPATIEQYKSSKAISITTLKKELIKNKTDLNLNNPKDNLKLLKALLTDIFKNFESQKFKNAVINVNIGHKLK